MKSGSKGGSIDNKDEVIKVTINLDGKIQTIDLNNVSYFFSSEISCIVH